MGNRILNLSITPRVSTEAAKLSYMITLPKLEQQFSMVIWVVAPFGKYSGYFGHFGICADRIAAIDNGRLNLSLTRQGQCSAAMLQCTSSALTANSINDSYGNCAISVNTEITS